MGCAQTLPQSPESLAIDAEIALESQRRRSIKRVYVSCFDEEGEALLMKQMYLLYCGGGEFPQEIVEQYTVWVKDVLYQCVERLLKGTIELAIPLLEANRNLQGLVETVQLSAGHVLALPQDPAIKKILELGRHFHLPYNTGYLIEHCARILSDGYMATSEDILRCPPLPQDPERGILETVVEFEGVQYVFVQLFQRTEQNRWFPLLQDVDGIFRIAAASVLEAYDVTLYEDERVNIIHEEMHFFDNIVNSKWTRNTRIVCIFDIREAFKIKAQTQNLNLAFARYDGGLDGENAASFLLNIFESTVRKTDAQTADLQTTHAISLMDGPAIRVAFEQFARSL